MQKVEIDINIADIKLMEYTIYFCNVVETIQFLLGHRPFKNNFTYAFKHHNSLGTDIQVYNKMHTGNWWWLQQEQLPDEATVVLLLLVIDKTVLTQHHGDLAIWPVYLTIGNLDIKTYKSQIKPGMVLLGLISIAKIGEKHGLDLKAKVYHKAMGHMLQHKCLLSLVN